MKTVNERQKLGVCSFVLTAILAVLVSFSTTSCKEKTSDPQPEPPYATYIGTPEKRLKGAAEFFQKFNGGSEGPFGTAFWASNRGALWTNSANYITITTGSQIFNDAVIKDFFSATEADWEESADGT